MQSFSSKSFLVSAIAGILYSSIMISTVDAAYIPISGSNNKRNDADTYSQKSEIYGQKGSESNMNSNKYYTDVGAAHNHDINSLNNLSESERDAYFGIKSSPMNPSTDKNYYASSAPSVPPMRSYRKRQGPVGNTGCVNNMYTCAAGIPTSILHCNWGVYVPKECAEGLFCGPDDFSGARCFGASVPSQ
ncbi:hypothetical protein AYI70_g2531 [Smittium culicis]|uniref:Uncharacterized protein n=1 Tax=Smittium culicis TaxID=133412 RepID=A0A1R1Y804_9FUNG|nr:hypothetical protein AYI70_g2531 [Smittium culicis]